jgi:hypothetical protein
VELLTGLIHWINARAERRVEKELIGGLTEVPGKKGIYLRMVNAALDKPDETVREAVWPVVPDTSSDQKFFGKARRRQSRVWRPKRGGRRSPARMAGSSASLKARSSQTCPQPPDKAFPPSPAPRVRGVPMAQWCHDSTSDGVGGEPQRGPPSSRS